MTLIQTSQKELPRLPLLTSSIRGKHGDSDLSHSGQRPKTHEKWASFERNGYGLHKVRLELTKIAFGSTWHVKFVFCFRKV